MTAPPPLRLGAAIGWGLFLASSWTWVIGMWLPVLLIGDFGWPGWVAFALPNVAGAMLVGFVLRPREAAIAFREQHAGIMRLFSVWTVLFHVAFLSWFLTGPLSQWTEQTWIASVVSLWALGMAWLLSRLGGRALLACAGLAWAASTLILIASLFADTDFVVTTKVLHAPPAPTDAVWPGLVWSSVPLAFGFLLCPYLDLTIVRARIEAPGRTGDGAFVLGFGVFFLVLIAGTLFYAWAIVTGRGLSDFVAAHILAQSIFTMAVHLRELRERGWLFDRARATRTVRIFERVAIAGLVLLALSAVDGVRTGREELYYNLLLSAYALLFPAYVWIACVPRREGLLRPGVLVGASVLLAAPALWLGAIEQRWAFLPLGVAIPLMAPLLNWGLPKRATASS